MIKAQKLKYQKGSNDQIFQQLRSEANTIVNRLVDKRKGERVFKAILFPTLYFAAWACILLWGRNPAVLFSCYPLMGVLLVLNYLNVIHDAVHHAIFKSRRLNEQWVYLFDLMGANSYIWKTRHVLYHHNYPNVDGWDTDIDQSALVKVVPQAPSSRFHKYQHIYLPFIYPLFLFNWLLIRDFKDFFSNSRIVQKRISIPKKEFVKLFFFKALYFMYMLVVPKLVLGISWATLLPAFIIMIFTASILALLVLLPPHANIEAEFPSPDNNKRLPYDWLLHMLKTTNDVNGENWFTRFVLGNYNYHIVHHLFPNIHHSYYPEITERLKLHAANNHLPYRSYQFGATLKNHYLLLKQNRTDFNIWEEDM
ncbi:MAG: fatty acid desaturase [Sphingobacteriales bacterium]|nr:fatty acid desaturase [Sphingobacteriales bacterium]OJY90359.1 MAG: linoleoyl-CoA desaturase [Sphingobacteriales bacterium 44-15]